MLTILTLWEEQPEISAFIQIEQAARDLELQINESKAKYVVTISAPKTKEERRILRRIFGPLQEFRFRSLHNNEIAERYHDRLFVNKMRLKRLQWAGHLIRMDEDDPAQKVYKDNIDDRKKNAVDTASY